MSKIPSRLIVAATLAALSLPAMAQYQVRIPYDANVSDKAEDEPSIDNTSCRAILTTGGSVGSGVYSVNYNNVTQDIYCDMETNGGGWMLVGHWQSATLPVSGNGPLGGITYGELSVRGNPLTTFTINNGSYPVLAQNTINDFSEQLYIGGTDRWKNNWVNIANDMSGRVDWISYPMFAAESLPVRSYAVQTNLGPATMYAAESAWGHSITTDRRWGLWPSIGNNAICGGNNAPGAGNCPFLRGAHYGAHYDFSSQKFLFVR